MHILIPPDFHIICRCLIPFIVPINDIIVPRCIKINITESVRVTRLPARTEATGKSHQNQKQNSCENLQAQRRYCAFLASQSMTLTTCIPS